MFVLPTDIKNYSSRMREQLFWLRSKIAARHSSFFYSSFSDVFTMFMLLTCINMLYALSQATDMLHFSSSGSIFTRATLGRAGISCRRVSVCLSVHPSVTSRRSSETDKRRVTHTTPRDSPGIRVF